MILFYGIGDTYKAVAYSTDASLDMSRSLIDVGGKTTGSWDEKKTRKAGWTMSSSHLLADTSNVDLVGLFTEGTILTIVLAQVSEHKDSVDVGNYTIDTEKYSYVGNAIITKLSLKATNGQTATFSVELTGTGNLQKKKYEDGLTVTGDVIQDVNSKTVKLGYYSGANYISRFTGQQLDTVIFKVLESGISYDEMVKMTQWMSLLKADDGTVIINSWDKLVRFLVGCTTEKTLMTLLDEITKSVSDGYLSKTKEDFTNFLIRFLGGAEFGKYTEGILGTGAKIDSDGNINARKITAWEGLFTTVLSFNQVDVIQGQLLISDCRGVIESVDTDRQIITERFSNDESYSSVHVGDILRGVYNNLAETKWQDKATTDYKDSSGFESKVGYFTSYFTPVEILESNKGVCRFRYAIKDGSLHPCPDMRFAAYGSFTEKLRQGCTLVTESTMIIYRNVNTWTVSDDVNLAKIEGKLDGHSRTSIDGTVFQLTGWGSYQNGNAYIDGANIQLNSIQGLSDEIKNNSGYQITVQSETRQLKVDDQGNVINGIKKTVNGATIYNVQASLLVAKGTDYLTLFGFDSTADTTLSGHYTIDVQPHGCSCILQSGNVIVTAIEGLQDGDSSTVNFDYDKMRNIHEISVDVLINCEGNIVLTKTFHVPIIHTEVPFISSDLSNEMDSFGYNKISLAKVGLPISTTISLYKGIDKVSADTISLDLTGYTNNYDSSTHTGVLKDLEGNTVLSYTLGFGIALTGEINITDVSPDLASKLAVGINATVTYAGVVYERRCVLTINRIDSDVVYNVLPSVSQIVGRYNTSKVLVNSPTSVSCSVLAKTTSGVTTLSDLTGKCTLKYIVDDGTETAYSSAVSVSSATNGIKFNLYDTSGNLIDSEFVPIVNDGVQGENAVTYKIAVYASSIKISKTGSTTPTTISCAINQYNGDTMTQLPWNNLPSGIVLWYSVDGGGEQTYGGPFYTSGITTNANLILRKDGNIIDTVTIPAVKDGADGTKGDDGAKGKTGPFLYPAGVYSGSKYYTRTDTAIPFVLYNGSYWALDGSYYKTGGEGYVTGSTPSSSSQYWTQFNMMEYVFTKVLMADYGQLSSAIFNGDFMISQQGVDSNGNSSSDYTSFNSDSGSFMPNIMINFLTGAIKSRLTYTPLTRITYSNSQHTLNPNVDGNHIDVTTFSSGNILALPSPSAWKGLTLYFFFAIPYTRVASYQPTLSGSMVVDGYIVSTYSFTTNTAEFYSDGMYWYKMK